jgi:hypothetical protein
MKNYKEFISSNKINEGFFSNIFKKIGSAFRGDKQTISNNVRKMIELEKDFINKSDELNYSIFNSEFRKSTDPVVLTNIKQKSIISKRALEAMKSAKNAEILFLHKQISDLCKKNPGLIDNYRSEKVTADTEIAKYAYDKAKQFKDTEYEREFYNQWKNLEVEEEKIKKTVSPDFDYDIDELSDLGIFDMPDDEFLSQMSMYSRNDLNSILEEAVALKLALDEKYNTYNLKLRGYKNFYAKADPMSQQLFREQQARIKSNYKKNSLALNSKISMLKNKLRNRK